MPVKKRAKESPKSGAPPRKRLATKKAAAPRNSRVSNRTSGLVLAGESVPSPIKPGTKGLLADVREMILTTRQTVAQGVNSALTLLYWEIGQRIRQDVLQSKRADYGGQIVHALSAQLEREFGRGFNEKNLWCILQFADVFPDRKIVVSLIRELSWTHFLRLIPIDEPLKRDFYAEMCRIEKWNTRTLPQKIQSMLYERTALSKKPDKLIAMELKHLREEDKLSPDLVFYEEAASGDETSAATTANPQQGND